MAVGDPPDPRPDPATDLHWSDFGGAIQDIFAERVEKHPQKSFVVETASSIAGERSFTYNQIHQASNVVASHLIDHGIKVGDVVMIYAYRGVDLVIAIIGVLKSGAAFSVLDPIYPDDRQCIYLEVAQPKGLIVIAKASQEAGRISSNVRNWIDENLDLRVEIPALEIFDNGTIKGGQTGSTNGQDCLSNAQIYRDKHPTVLVGPDSQATLSFTSGSEGRPKGVRGRHFSLAYYTPWMAKTFGLSDQDRFTMLSGIAHDPIQRDIFTPIFLGARLLIPAKEDIQHGNLAEWMKLHNPSVCHLTPAMGQILLGGAVGEVPSLQNAFFVGDILMRRDCRVLQNLAPNCSIVNMYGSTETNRAVSYFKIPCQKEEPTFLESMPDVIPAGKGMKDVQLLVVDRHSLETEKPTLCNVGESGEIFVRAGGLAEGYLASEDLNKEKFVQNFFLKDPETWIMKEQQSSKEDSSSQTWRRSPYWKGPRDRLYRSGDLGRYTEQGDVECTGRADNQVKIRGFRIELGEIDTYLSQHPLVQENVTLVRRDKDEEPTLVSYFVVDMVKWPQWLHQKNLADQPGDDSMLGMLKRFRILFDDLRAELRKKLAHYAVPTVFIPLKSMPMTPNYKVDKKALPYPDVAELAEAAIAAATSGQALTATQKVIRQTWATHMKLPAEAIDLEDDFTEIGGHSMQAHQIMFNVKQWAKKPIPMAVLAQNPTVRSFAAAVDNCLHGSEEAQANGQFASTTEDYANDARELVGRISATNRTFGDSKCKNILLTGATGFLGAAILIKYLQDPESQVTTIVRAKTVSEAMERVITSCRAYFTWSESWRSRISCIPGDLSRDYLGLSTAEWHNLEENIDRVVHCAATVHWIKTYTALRATNVLSTLSLINLCSVSKPKHITFVSSTAVFDNQQYASDKHILESDDLGRSQTDLSTGYGQTKWVSEYLLREAGKRGLQGTIVRPGYITGNHDTGIGPTDDFLLRMLKGSVQAGCFPDLGPNTINLVPVDYCADVVVSASLIGRSMEKQNGVVVYQTTPHPQLSFNTFLSSLQACGYDCPMVPYRKWCIALENYVAADEKSKDSHALLPLLEWVTSDLPSDTQSKLLDDSNTQALLQRCGIDTATGQVTEETIRAYVRFMVAVGFLEPPPQGGDGEKLGKLEMGKAQREALGKVGRGGG